ncbi:putative RNA-directed DNA polymerase from transposon X-element [Penaeus vannamei]|uniref:Putative RNA-directed DNA polymerase from transposon X-element n=1 Tax=Penaeus vannamei TaxID=6689 RepID=A0A3R7MIE8_PENVA|nr:putative RNA-directed DNA polymerase from transposon X-element [Penaeus vannamei]
MKAKLTLVLKKLDRQVVNESEQDIVDEIMASIPEAKVDHVFVMKLNYMIKVRFSDHAAAKLIKEKGLYLFKVFVASWQVEFERFTPLKQCTNCIAYGHLKPQCKAEKKTRALTPTGSARARPKNASIAVDLIGHSQIAAQHSGSPKGRPRNRRPLMLGSLSSTRSVRTSGRRPLWPSPQSIWPSLTNLSKEILIVLLHAHMQNLIEHQLGFRYHAKAALRRNNLPDLDLGESDSWGILKVVQPSTQANKPTSTPSPLTAQAPAQASMPPPTQALTTVPQPPQPPAATPHSVQVAQTAQADQGLPQRPDPRRQSVRPKNLTITPQAEATRDPLDEEDDLDTPDAPPPTPDIHTAEKSYVDVDGIKRLRDMDPKLYGIRLFAQNPSKYQYSDRFEIGQEIQNKRIKAHLHHHIRTDDVTSSDHLPVILTLSTNPIMIPTQPRESLKHGNWEGFRQALENTHVTDLEEQPTHTIDTHLEQWYADIQTAPHRLCQNTKDPKTFWSSYKMLMGSNKQTTTFLYNANRQKSTRWRCRHSTGSFGNRTSGSPLPRTPTSITPQRPRLRHIFNASLATGYFPDKFKHATVTLIVKSGKSAHEVGNYHPISLLEVPGKLLERLITRRLITHLENNKHNSKQYGFRPHIAIALVYEEIALGLANEHQINITLRDVSKAFDKTIGLPQYAWEPTWAPLST